MATYQQRQFWKQSLPIDLTKAERAVAYELLDLAIEAIRMGKPLTPRNAVLAQMVGTSIRTVQRATAKLTMAGCFTKARRFIVDKATATARRISNRLTLILEPKERAWRVPEIRKELARLEAVAAKIITQRTTFQGLICDDYVTPKIRRPYSDRFSPSETYKRLMKQGLSRYRK